MATYTPNHNLGKPESTDEFKDFRQLFNDNMDIIDNMSGGGGSSTLAGLSDVSISTPITNDALIYDGAEWANTPLSDVAFSGDYTDLINKPSIPTTLGALNDVTISGQTSGEVLTYDGSKWVNGSVSVPSDIDDLSDVTITTPTNGEVLKYNNGTWENGPDDCGDTVTWTQVQNTGTKIAEISINGASTDVYAPTSGGSSGHTILNSNGTAMTDRSNLQFDDLSVTDDSVNDKTIVSASGKADKSDLTSIVQNGSTASQAISNGTYFYLNGTLVRAISDIASGATFTANTNYEVVTAGGLNDILNWTYLGEKTGSSAFSLPTTFNELYVVIRPNNSTLYVPMLIISDDLSATAKTFRIGYYSTSAYNNGCSISVSLTGASLVQVYQNGSDVTSNTKCKIYYR